MPIVRLAEAVTGVMIFITAACQAPQPRTPPGVSAETPPLLADLDRRYEAMRTASEQYGPGGLEVLALAHRVLREGWEDGRWLDVGLEDLWTEALQEGRTLFNDPSRRWGQTTALETKDMLGQTTIGPWQITLRNVREQYGLPYGVQQDWSDRDIYAYCRDNPEIQVAMICDYIAEAYDRYGRRGPYAIQKYFWLEAYARGQIGRGAWDSSVLPNPPDGDWRKLTPEMKADTGFYAKQIVCGWRGGSERLLYWLCVTGDDAAIRELLKTWRDQPRMAWDDRRKDAVLTGERGGFTITRDDLRYLAAHPACAERVGRLVDDVLAETR